MPKKLNAPTQLGNDTLSQKLEKNETAYRGLKSCSVGLQGIIMFLRPIFLLKNLLSPQVTGLVAYWRFQVAPIIYDSSKCTLAGENTLY